ncbi:glucarate dehydratase family protein [Arthrobacter sp. OY3WO11]|uniref:glucarate dehydratase family protein n=1 Tax=Arthrobacter sp. OY3WO11 TaxID=1835723 RepID=UPI0007CFF2C8|nr:glucarate dehydratase family protein [Arthrobacter sp. OY3WO11]OAE02791.1 glucarate dehydratase [Arthrobacter sp. OY3WO11]
MKTSAILPAAHAPTAADLKITEITITPIAFSDPPLLNAVGVHEPLVHRVVIEVQTANGLLGLGECAGGQSRLDNLAVGANAIKGLGVFDTSLMEQLINEALDPALSAFEKAAVFSAFEVAALDIQGHATGRTVSELLGGTVRDEVPFSAYLFYKWAEHPAMDGKPAITDEWGEALDPAGIVRQAQKMISEYGFKSIKLKGGVFPPAQEIEAIKALREAFPEMPLRLDPNTAWTVETSQWVARETDGLLEYLEDPTPGLEGMGEVAATAAMPLATNMCVVAFDHIKRSVELDSVQVILGDHHYWGGLRHTRELGTICQTFGIGLSMHSNSHLGISLAAMVHVAAATPALTYACDTHYPWNGHNDVVKPGVLRFVDGSVRVPTGTGLGVELDREKLAELHQQYLDARMTARDDTGYMQRFVPDYTADLPRW